MAPKYQIEVDFDVYRELMLRREREDITFNDVFKFMYYSNLRSRGLLSRSLQKAAFSTSVALSERWPRAERWAFGRLGRAVEAARQRQQSRDRALGRGVHRRA